MNKYSKDEIKQALVLLAEQVEAGNYPDKGYILVMLKKLYRLILGHTRPNHKEAMEEWLDLQAFCELQATFEYWDLQHKERLPEDNLLNLKRLQNDIRQGVYRHD